MSSVGVIIVSGGRRCSAPGRVTVIVPRDDSARIQEAHIFIGHTWCGEIESALGC